MGADGEEHLAQTLVDPEALDDPAWTKGEKQEPKFRDAWAAILFYAHFVAIIAVAAILGVPAIQTHITPHTDAASDAAADTTVDYTGIIYASLIAGGFSLLFSSLSLFIMSMCPRFLIKISLLFSLVISLLVVLYCFSIGNYIGGGFGAFFFAISVCYACLVWKRIPFAAANLNTGLTAVKRNAGVITLSYVLVILSFGFTVVWMAAAVGVYDKEGLCETTTAADGTPKTVCGENNLAAGYFFLLFLSLFWTEQVFQNTIHTTIAGVVSTWWFAPEDASSCCSVAIKDSFVRATTTSFGSICFGSLLVAIIRTLRAMIENARDDAEGVGAILLCIAECLIRCLEGALEYFNKFAYIYVGMYGYGYLEAGKNVISLFQARGWSVIIADDLISNVLFLFYLVIGLLTGCVGLVLNETNPEWFAGYQGDPQAIAFGFLFVIGLVVSAVTLSVIDSSVNTVLVCFAEAPAEFEENHPEHSAEMREAWMAVYPAECGF